MPDSDSDTDREDIPLAELQKRIKRKRCQVSESEDELPLSELAKKLKEDKRTEPAEPPRTSVKRRLPSETDSLPLPDFETAEPPTQYGIHSPSDIESDIPDMDAVDTIAGACVQPPCVKNESPSVKEKSPCVQSASTNSVASKEQLLSQMMKANEELMRSMMAQNDNLMKSMMAQSQSMMAQNQSMMTQNQLLTGQMLAQLEKM